MGFILVCPRRNHLNYLPKVLEAQGGPCWLGTLQLYPTWTFPGNSSPDNLTSVPGKMVEKVILDTAGKPFKDNACVRHRHLGITEGNSRLTGSLSRCHKVTGLKGGGKAVPVHFWDCSRSFGPVPHRILLEVSGCAMSRDRVCWLPHWL